MNVQTFSASSPRLSRPTLSLPFGRAGTEAPNRRAPSNGRPPAKSFGTRPGTLAPAELRRIVSDMIG